VSNTVIYIMCALEREVLDTVFAAIESLLPEPPAHPTRVSPAEGGPSDRVSLGLFGVVSGWGDRRCDQLGDGQFSGDALCDGIVVNQLDIVDAYCRNAYAARTLESFGRIDGLVNNAGLSGFGPTEEMPDEIVRDQSETNFFGYYCATKHASEQVT
jgi:NAD(P)-dependent dehydrogenase (short-subunit alcohol dehydrogenase family)